MIGWQIHIRLALYSINCLGSLPIPGSFPRLLLRQRQSSWLTIVVFFTAVVLHTPEAILHITTDNSEPTMPTESLYPKVDIPNVDLWTFLFERNDRPFPDDKSMQ